MTQFVELPIMEEALEPSPEPLVFAEPREAPAAPWEGRGLVHSADLYVLFTSLDGTLAALRVAGQLAHSLDSTVRLVDFRVIPQGAPVDAPTGRSPIETSGLLDRVRAEGIEVRANVYVCRAAGSAIPRVFKDHSVVLIGGRHHWWRTRADRWRRLLEQRGYFVLFVDQDRHPCDGRRRLGQ